MCVMYKFNRRVLREKHACNDSNIPTFSDACHRASSCFTERNRDTYRIDYDKRGEIPLSRQQGHQLCTKLVQNIKHWSTVLTEANTQTSHISWLELSQTTCSTKQYCSNTQTHTHAALLLLLQSGFNLSYWKVCVMCARGGGLKEHAWEHGLSAASRRPTWLLCDGARNSPRWKRRLKCVSAPTDWAQQLTQRCLNWDWQR